MRLGYKMMLSGLLIFGAFLLIYFEENTANATELQASERFSDISGHWAETAIRKAADLGIVEGYTDGTYKPGANVTRAEFAAMLARATSHVPQGKVTGAFSDVPAGNWAYEPVNKVTNLGFINRVDYPNGLVPNKAMTRIEIAKWMTNGLAAEDGEYNKAMADVQGPNALIPVAEFFKGGLNKADYPYISIVVGTGLMTGDTNGKFNLSANTTRAEVATILLRYVDTERIKATDFYALNELREVAKTGTNFNTFGKAQVFAPDPRQLKNVQDVFGQKLKLRNDIADVTMTKMIFVDPYPVDGTKSVYYDMFHSNAEPTAKGFYSDKYRIFTENTFTSKTDNMDRLGALADSGLPTGLGRRLFDSNAEKYGVNSYSISDTRNKYKKGQGEVNVWAATILGKEVDATIPYIETISGKLLYIGSKEIK